jgi:hypothetical protein
VLKSKYFVVQIFSFTTDRGSNSTILRTYNRNLCVLKQR